MADANHKPRRARAKPPTMFSMVLEEAPDVGKEKKPSKRPAFPWMQIADSMLERLGFLPGQHVMFSIDHSFGHIVISPDRSYMIEGRPMTEEEIEAMER
jgi:hypothetical protein